MKVIVKCHTEIEGKYWKFRNAFANENILFIIGINSKLFPNENGELYSIIDVNVEQGRRFIVETNIESEVNNYDLTNGIKVEALSKVKSLRITNCIVVDVAREK